MCCIISLPKAEFDGQKTVLHNHCVFFWQQYSPRSAVGNVREPTWYEAVFSFSPKAQGFLKNWNSTKVLKQQSCFWRSFKDLSPLFALPAALSICYQTVLETLLCWYEYQEKNADPHDELKVPKT